MKKILLFIFLSNLIFTDFYASEVAESSGQVDGKSGQTFYSDDSIAVNKWHILKTLKLNLKIINARFLDDDILAILTEHQIIYFDLINNKVIDSSNTYEKHSACNFFSKNIIAFGSPDGSLNFIDLEEQENCCTIKNDSCVNCVEFLDEHTVAVGLENGKVCIWDMQDKSTPLVTFQNDEPVISLQKDCKILSTGSRSGKVNLWNLDKPTDPISSLQSDGQICSSHLLPGYYLAIALSDGQIKIWDLNEHTLVQALQTDQDICSIQLLSGNILAVISSDGTLIFYQNAANSMIEDAPKFLKRKCVCDCVIM